MRRKVAKLVFPGVWTGMTKLDDVEAWVRAGVGGVVLFGGHKESTPAYLDKLRKLGLRFVMSDLEDGAGQQVKGATEFPSNMAVGATGSEKHAYDKGFATACEARAVGIDWVLAPVLDVNTNAGNPVINVRAFGSDAALVKRLGAALARGLRDGGALNCGKHFPGHGDTSVDSHVVLPEGRGDVGPFGIDLDAVMIAHLKTPYDEKIAPLSAKVVGMLPVGFKGPVVSDAFIMRAISNLGPEHETAADAINAGIDVILCPQDAPGLIDRLATSSRLSEARVDEAIRRLESLPSRPAGSVTPNPQAIADDAIALVRGHLPIKRFPIRLVTIRDDTSRADTRVFHEALAKRERVVEKFAFGGTTVAAVYSRVRAFRGSIGLGDAERRALEETKPDIIVLFGNPFVKVDAKTLVCAWSEDASSQRAAAKVLLGEMPARGKAPVTV